MKITWICQGGFVFEIGSKRIVVDPYMSNALALRGHNRMQPVPLSFGELKPDYVIFTHDHLDHYDPETVPQIVKLYPDCILAGPSSVMKHHAEAGFDVSAFILLDKGMELDGGSFKIRAVEAQHSDEDAVGLLIEAENLLVYLSGDTLYNENLSKKILAKATRNPDIAIVCINGKLGNMPWQDSVKLVGELKPKIAIPMHYGLFEKNTEDPQPFADAVSSLGVKAVLMEAGKPLSI